MKRYIHDIDLSIVEYKNMYLGFHKPGDVGDKMGNRLSIAKSLDPSKGSFADDGHGKIVFSGEIKPTERPEVVKLIGQEKWYVYADPFNAPMQAWETTDFASYKPISINTDLEWKHCSIIPITSLELEMLLKEYP